MDHMSRSNVIAFACKRHAGQPAGLPQSYFGAAGRKPGRRPGRIIARRRFAGARRVGRTVGRAGDAFVDV